LQDRTVASILEEAQSSESSSLNSPLTRESTTAVLEADIMAEEQPRRVTLKAIELHGQRCGPTISHIHIL